MEFIALHAKFKDEDSPSVEGQIRWLQKQGFAQHHIEQAMMETYDEVERGVKTFEGSKKGWDLDQYLLEKAKVVRTRELMLQVRAMEEYHSRMREKWGADLKALAEIEAEKKKLPLKKPPLWKRILFFKVI